jgi:SAM-dependent methyltransferase
MESFYRSSSYKNETIEQVRQNEPTYYPDASTDADRIIALCRKLAQGPRFLDIGAGYGEYSRAAARSGMNVTACEPNANSRRIFSALNGFEPESRMFDTRYTQETNARFDVALASHVLEHVPEPGAFVENLSLVLKPGGIGAIAVPHYGSVLSRFQGKNDMFISPPEHLNFFSRRGLVDLFERQGFDLLALRTVSKVNRTTVGNKFRWRPLQPLAWRTLYLSLRVSDFLGRGMVLNAFFKKGR